MQTENYWHRIRWYRNNEVTDHPAIRGQTEVNNIIYSTSTVSVVIAILWSQPDIRYKPLLLHTRWSTIIFMTWCSAVDAVIVTHYQPSRWNQTSIIFQSKYEDEWRNWNELKYIVANFILFCHGSVNWRELWGHWHCCVLRPVLQTRFIWDYGMVKRLHP